MVSNIFWRPFVFFIQTSSFLLKFLLMPYSVWEHTSHLNPDTQVAKGLSAGSGLAVRRKACGGLHLQVGGFSYRCFSSLTLRNLGFNISSNRNLFALFVNTVRRTVHFFHVSYRILRLCPLSKFGKRALTEKCFQRMPLRFFTNKTWIRTLHRSGKVSRCHRKMNWDQKQTWSCNKNLFSQDGGPWRHIEPHWRRSHRAASGRKWRSPTKGCGRPTTTLAR